MARKQLSSYSAAEDEFMREHRSKNSTYPEIAKVMTEHFRRLYTSDQIYNRLRRNGIRSRTVAKADPLPEPSAGPQRHGKIGEIGVTTIGDNEQVVSMVTNTIRTKEEFLAVAKVDLEIWDVLEYTINKWDGFARVRSYKHGAHDYRRELGAVSLFQVKIKLVKRPEHRVTMKTLREAMLADFDKHSPAYPKIKRKPVTADDRIMAEISIPDHHFGKHCWGEETGMGNYDLKIAEKDYITAVDDLIHKIKPYQISEILLPIGNDMLHVDNRNNETANGTRQDVDGRWQKAFQVAKRCLVRAIEMCREVAPVRVIVIPGNHDTERMFYMGEVIASHFRLDKEVAVDNRANPTKFVEFGKTLLGFCHGDNVAESELPLIMAGTQKESFARTCHWEWHVGHKHTRSLKKFKMSGSKLNGETAVEVIQGVHVRILPALCPPDAWHASHGYILGPRASEVYLWQWNMGYAGHLVHTHQ